MSPAGAVPPAELPAGAPDATLEDETPARDRLANAMREAAVLLSWGGWPRTPYAVSWALADRASSVLASALYGEDEDEDEDA